jgi:hypothetical protein
MDKTPKFNYRKFYEEKTGKKIPKDFDVHHIDLNRENNEIENLVAIPKHLHKKYHSLLCKIMPLGGIKIDKTYFTPLLAGDSEMQKYYKYYIHTVSMVEYQLKIINKYITEMDCVLNEITSWTNFKLLLLNELPDFRTEELYKWHKTIY